MDDRASMSSPLKTSSARPRRIPGRPSGHQHQRRSTKRPSKISDGSEMSDRTLSAHVDWKARARPSMLNGSGANDYDAYEEALPHLQRPSRHRKKENDRPRAHTQRKVAAQLSTLDLDLETWTFDLLQQEAEARSRQQDKLLSRAHEQYYEHRPTSPRLQIDADHVYLADPKSQKPVPQTKGSTDYINRSADQSRRPLEARPKREVGEALSPLDHEPPSDLSFGIEDLNFNNARQRRHPTVSSPRILPGTPSSSSSSVDSYVPARCRKRLSSMKESPPVLPASHTRTPSTTRPLDEGQSSSADSYVPARRRKSLSSMKESPPVLPASRTRTPPTTQPLDEGQSSVTMQPAQVRCEQYST